MSHKLENALIRDAQIFYDVTKEYLQKLAVDSALE